MKNQPFESAFAVGGDSRPGLKLSAHAKERMNLRGIHLSQGDMTRLSDAVDVVASKGGKQSILVMDQLAFIVSVTNRTVITVLDGGSLKEHAFINIDSAMIFSVLLFHRAGPLGGSPKPGGFNARLFQGGRR